MTGNGPSIIFLHATARDVPDRLIFKSGLSGIASNVVHNARGYPPSDVPQDEVASLRVPTLAVVGELDAPCRKPSQYLAQALPGARLEVLPAARHSVNVEDTSNPQPACDGFRERDWCSVTGGQQPGPPQPPSLGSARRGATVGTRRT